MSKNIPQNPLILRFHRLMEAFAKADDERDFYLDREEGFLLYIDLDKGEEELKALEKEFKTNPTRYVPLPKMTFYEVKKLMEGFVNDKVYDIDTKEKLLDIISSKEAKENFLEFMYDHHSELEKWQTYYIERSRVRIIEWLRNNQFSFVFEEDLDITKSIVEKLKISLFEPKVSKDLAATRKVLQLKAKTYYSNEALNPRPKRGRPPKQVAKVETEPQFSQDIYTAIPKAVKLFLFTPDYRGTAAVMTFSGQFSSEEERLTSKRQTMQNLANLEMANLDQKLATLRTLSSHWLVEEKEDVAIPKIASKPVETPKEVPQKVEKPQSKPSSTSKEKVPVKAPMKLAPKIESKGKFIKKASPPPAPPVKPKAKMHLRPLKKKKEVAKPEPKKAVAKVRHLRPLRKPAKKK